MQHTHAMSLSCLSRARPYCQKHREGTWRWGPFAAGVKLPTLLPAGAGRCILCKQESVSTGHFSSVVVSLHLYSPVSACERFRDGTPVFILWYHPPSRMIGCKYYLQGCDLARKPLALKLPVKFPHSLPTSMIMPRA